MPIMHFTAVKFDLFKLFHFLTPNHDPFDAHLTQLTLSTGQTKHIIRILMKFAFNTSGLNVDNIEVCMRFCMKTCKNK